MRWLVGRGVGGAGWDLGNELGNTHLLREILLPSQVSVPLHGSTPVPVLAWLLSRRAVSGAGSESCGRIGSSREVL